MGRVARVRMVGVVADLRVAVAILIGLLLVAWSAIVSVKPAFGQDEAQAAEGPPVNLAVLVSSDPNACYERGDVAAIRKLTQAQEAAINRRGGIGGRPLQLQFFDDESDARKTHSNMREILADPQLLGIVGLTSSDRGKAVFEGLAKDGIEGMAGAIGASGVPFITDMSVRNLFAGQTNVFSTRPSQDEGNAPIVAKFIREVGFARVAMIVNNDKLYSRTIGDALASGIKPGTLVADHRVTEKDNAIDPDGVALAVEDFKIKKPDIVVIAVGSTRTAPLLTAIQQAGLAPAIFMISTLDRIPDQIRNGYPNALYELTMNDLPEVYNATLGDLVKQGEADGWMFSGKKREDAPGWANGTCKPDDSDEAVDPLAGDNQRAIERGTQFADIVSLLATAANEAKPGSSVPARRRAILKAMTTTYASGQGAFRGNFNNWTFNAATRVAERPLLVVILPSGLEHRRRQLAPVQFVRLRDGTLRRIDTLYVDIDLIRAHRVDDSEKTFLAEFYLAIRANDNADINRLEFTNAFVDPRTNGRQLAIEELHDGSADAAYPDRMKIYRVTGRFLFRPRLAAYPFDTQRFFIELKPSSGTAFLIQPPPLSLRDRDVESDDWQTVDQYVGLGEDFIPVVDAYTHQPSVVPFYKAQFVWLMKREVNDYVLRVVVPLLFILIVAYVSIFIPHAHFEAIVTIQVTALLSAVALYLSLPQLDSDTATLSDRLFVLYYLLVSVMIVITIARINKHVAPGGLIKSTLGLVHTLGVPAMVAMMAWHVYTLSNAG